jgi:hypothetical protein
VYISVCSNGSLCYSDYVSLHCSIFLHTFFLTISINFILSLLLKDTTTILVPGIVVISYGLYMVVIWYWDSLVGRHQMSSFIHAGDIKTNSRHGGAICLSGITVIDNDMIVLCDSCKSRLLVNRRGISRPHGESWF